MSVWVCGEALVDVLPDKIALGGGPANTARALARRGRSVEFIGGISTDHFGKQIIDALTADGVGLKYVKITEKPTSTATVSVNEDDLRWLYPEVEALSVVQNWLAEGVEVVVMTRGSKGMVGLNRHEIVEVPAVNLELKDTVGAGDTVGAVLADALVKNGVLNLMGELFRDVLNCAALAAAITCSHEGAYSPTKSELKAQAVALKENRV